MSVVLFGSISTVADTSELQRQAFNDAFAHHGLDWQWDREIYRDLLRASGGERRIAEQARQRGVHVDAAAVHATKSELFRRALSEADVSLRPGVAKTIGDARAAGVEVGLVTTTSTGNVLALLSALAPAVDARSFDVIIDSSDVADVKPAPDAYNSALRVLGVRPASCVAIEDNLDGVQAARAARVPVVAFLNENTTGHDAGDATVVDHLVLGELLERVEA